MDDTTRRQTLFGNTDRNLRLIRAAFDVRITARDGTIYVNGDDEAVHRAARVLDEMQRLISGGREISDEQVDELIARFRTEGQEDTAAIEVFLPSASIVPKGEGQSKYVDAIRRHDLTFCAGPAGTGKTYLAVALAVSMLKRHRIKRIILARPAVEAGEKLGFLPGDMQAKVNPYLRPLFDAMHDMMTFEQIKRFMQTDVVEVVPLAFMRGRTLNHAAIILDEAQNATTNQMLMFLTRLGHDSKMIVTGDDSQSDLPSGDPSGFHDALRRLEGVDGVALVRLSKQDIVRHALVQRVVEAYGRTANSVR
ncbi:MAG: PhoH family protein [Phycisphaerae bacterium]|nr:PhoH family protein [Phycisphaerae bacterium]